MEIIKELLINNKYSRYLFSYIDKFLYRSSLIRNAYSWLYKRKYKRLFEKDPKLAADGPYFKTFGRHINWDNPVELNEKIRWMLINTDTSLWTKCADKYRVREYIKEKNCEDILVDLYGVWERPEDVDLNILPNSFVLKANNGCGTIKVIKDKSKIDIISLRKELKSWLSEPFGYHGAQLHYLRIKPCIIAEQLLEEKGFYKDLSPKSLIDYKVWCINGEPECILVIFGRENGHYFRQVYDKNWVIMPNVMTKENNHSKFSKDIELPKPQCLDLLLDYARKLSSDFPETRVDFYIIDNKPYFGELTFTAGMGSFTYDYYKYLGSKIDLSKLKLK